MRRHKASTMMETCLIGGLVTVVVIYASTNINSNYKKWATLSSVTTPNSATALSTDGSKVAEKVGSGDIVGGSAEALTTQITKTTTPVNTNAPEVAGMMGESIEVAGTLNAPPMPKTNTGSTTTSASTGKKKSIWDKLGDIADAVVEAVEDAVEYVEDEFHPPLPPSRGEVSESNPGSGDIDR